MISVAEAHAKVAACIQRLSTEDVPTREALGRVIAEPVASALTQPPFASSAMDGYAILSSDKVPGRELRVIGSVAAGQTGEFHVNSCEAVRIFTGAPVPRGADTIIIQEDVERIGERIVLAENLDHGTHIRPAGGDFASGTKIEAPRRLSASDLSLISAMNVPKVVATRRPLVAILPTGDELVALGETPQTGQIIASSGYAVASLLSACGADVRLMPIAPDRPEKLGWLLDLATSADLVLTLGGASVGDHDLVQHTAGDQGLDLSFYKIRMRPGKPLICGKLADAVFLGLPGNPVSAFVCARIFAVPAIAALQGMPYRAPNVLSGRLKNSIAPNGSREHFMRAHADIVDGQWVLEVFERQDSSLLSVLSNANALVIRQPGEAGQGEGTPMPFVPMSPDIDLTC